MAAASYLSAADGADATTLYLKGEWRVAVLEEIADALRDVNQTRDPAGPSRFQGATAEKEHEKAKARHARARAEGGRKPLVVDGADLDFLDVSAAFLLGRWLENTQELREVKLQNLKEPHRRLLGMVDRLAGAEEKNIAVCEIVERGRLDAERESAKKIAPHLPPRLVMDLVGLGHRTRNLASDIGAFFAFYGQSCVALVNVARHPSRLRTRSIVYHMFEIGVKALPIIILMSFLLSIVTGYQGTVQLRQFGATIYTVDLVAISMYREMAVLVTAIMVAGRSGSAFTAELGVMQTNEEIDALRTMGLDPFEVLVLPRLIAIMLVMPLLGIVADFAGVFGNYLMSITLLDLSGDQFLTRLHAIKFKHIVVGLAKAPFFAFVIGMVGCLRGFQVQGAAEAVGRYTTRAVVDAIFLVIIIDAIFSVFFSWMGW